MALKTNDLPSESLKMTGDVDEEMFHDVERPFERILYIPGIQKCGLDEVAEVMF
jgi:hypothetical protein